MCYIFAKSAAIPLDYRARPFSPISPKPLPITLIFLWRNALSYAYKRGMSGIFNMKTAAYTFFTIVSFLSQILSPVYASNLEVSPSEEIESGVSIVVRPLKDGISDEISSDVAAALREVLPKISRLKIIPDDIVERILAYYEKESDFLSKERRGAVENLAMAKDHYFSFQYDEALAETASAIEIFEQGDLSEAGALLQDALLTQGVIAKAAGNKELAMNSFDKAVRLDPLYKIDRMTFPPSVSDMYDKLKKGFLKEKTGALKVESSPPAAEVYLNGIMKGVTPLDLGLLPLGSYKILIKANKYRPVEKTVNLGEGGGVVVKETLAWSEPPTDAKRKMDVATTIGQVGEGARIAEIIKSDKVILVNCNETKSGNLIAARMVDRQYKSGYREVISYYDSVAQRSEAAAEVAEALAMQAQADLTRDPRKYLDIEGIGDPILLGARKKDFYRMPVFWGAIGTAAAGAVVGGVVAAVSGGSPSDTGSVSVSFKRRR